MQGMHIKPSHRGLFTKKAKTAGRSIGGQIEHDLHSNNVSGTEEKEANFARMARRGFKPLPKSQKSSRSRRLAKNLY